MTDQPYPTRRQLREAERARELARQQAEQPNVSEATTPLPDSSTSTAPVASSPAPAAEPETRRAHRHAGVSEDTAAEPTFEQTVEAPAPELTGPDTADDLAALTANENNDDAETENRRGFWHRRRRREASAAAESATEQAGASETLETSVLPEISATPEASATTDESTGAVEAGAANAALDDTEPEGSHQPLITGSLLGPESMGSGRVVEPVSEDSDSSTVADLFPTSADDDAPVEAASAPTTAQPSPRTIPTPIITKTPAADSSPLVLPPRSNSHSLAAPINQTGEVILTTGTVTLPSSMSQTGRIDLHVDPAIPPVGRDLGDVASTEHRPVPAKDAISAFDGKSVLPKQTGTSNGLTIALAIVAGVLLIAAAALLTAYLIIRNG